MNTIGNFRPSRIANSDEPLPSAANAKSDSAELVKKHTNQPPWPFLSKLGFTNQLPFESASRANAPQPFNILSNVGQVAPSMAPVANWILPRTSGTNTLPNVGNMPYYIQEGNACGTTTLAEIMSYLGVPMTQADVDNGIRRWNTFTAPEDMIEFARDHGLEAEGYNHGTWAEVKSMLDAGCPVQAMVSGDDGVSVNGGATNFSVDGLHYIAITGYGTDPATGEEFVTYHDPNRSSEQRMSVSDFQKMWGDVPGGFDNYFVAYGRDGANLPPGRDDGIESTQGVLNGVTNITNALDRLTSPDSIGSFIHGLAELPGGVFQTIGSFGGGLLQLGAGWLNDAVEGIPVLENIVQPFGDLVNGAGAVIGDVFNGFGEAWDSVGGAFESLADGDFGGFVGGVGDAVGDVVGGAVDAVGDAASAVGNAVSDFFSGW